MSHTRKDTLVRSKEWGEHLRPTGKRIQSSRERAAARNQIYKEIEKYIYGDDVQSE